MKWISCSTIILGAAAFYFFVRQKNNVCTSFQDYYSDRDNNENCYYNPDYKLTMEEIVKRNGYPVEVHNITTEDGYILTMYRIPHGKNYNDKAPRQPVLLQHGIALSSECFINTGRKSLGFILADAGYDVWMGNFRGTTHSRKHVSMDDTNRKYWNFSFGELGVYDIRSKIDYVFEKTQQKVIFIGYSIGTTASFIYSLTYPELSQEKVKILIQLAPVVYLYHWSSLPKFIISRWSYGEAFMKFFSYGGVFPREYLPNSFKKYACLPLPFQMNVCQFIDMLLWGFDYEQNDPETLPITILKDSDSVSLKTLWHCSQQIVSGDFKNYDYGIEINKEIYGSRIPPHYNLSAVNVPVYLVRSENDLMSTKEDIETLYNALPKHVKGHGIYTVKHKSFNHIDFLLARDVVPLLYDHLLQFMAHL